MSADKKKKLNYRLPEAGLWANAWKISLLLCIAGLIGLAVGYTSDPHRFAFSYLYGFHTTLTLGLGGMFLTLILHLTSASWGVTSRRTAEFVMAALPALLVFFIPVALQSGTLYEWMHAGDGHGAEHGESAEHAAVLDGEDGEKGAIESLLGGTVASAQEAASAEAGAAEAGAAEAGAAEAAPAAETASAEAAPAEGAPAAEGTETAASAGEAAGAAEGSVAENADELIAAKLAEEAAEREAAEAAAGSESHAAGAHGEGAQKSPMEEALHHEVLAHKAPFLSGLGWSIRAGLYWIVWMLIAFGYFRWSTRQDRSRDKKLTVSMQKLSPVAMMAFGLTLTFAAFDWLMSLEPAWYSTIYGVHVFSGSTVAIFALVIVITMSLAEKGYIGKAVNVEHFHDLGKLLFGFICFWTYIGFSQWMLIWYAGIPEEATYYHRRWTGGWETVSMFLLFGHFVAPFLFAMSRVAKRKLGVLKLVAVWMLFMHCVDTYWYVMPYATDGEPHFGVSMVDIAALLFVGGGFFTVVFKLMTRYPLIPTGDPRLSRSLHHVQTH